MGGRKKQPLGATVHRRGVTFRVWAPNAKHVAVAVPYVGYDTSNQVAMESDGHGYWSVTVKEAEPGQSYKYLITTRNDEVWQRNDPQGRALTTSDNGISVIVANDFDWGDDIFMPVPKNQQVIYELHIGTFHRRDASTQGTFYDAIEKLDYLESLGINMIELMPVTSMSFSEGWGYNINSLFSIENSYGGRHGLMSFVRACHDRGIGVIADVVYNHFHGPDIWQFDGASDEYPGGIYFYGGDGYKTPWGARPNYARPEVRQYILDSVAMWFLEFRLDGLRLDSTAYLRNLDGGDDLSKDVDGAWSMLQDITDLAHRIRPGSIVIAEDTGSNDYIVKPRDWGGAGFDAQWRLAFPEALYQSLGIPARYPADIKNELSQRYTDDPFTRVVFSDSHDTAANGRARLNEVIAPRQGEGIRAQQELLLANTIALTSPGIPMLLQGQEFMQDGAFNAWQDLDWENVNRYPAIVQAHSDLIDLRRNQFGDSAGLCGKSLELFHSDDDNRVLAYHRWDSGGEGDDTIIIANFGDSPFTSYDLTLPVGGVWRLRFCSALYYGATTNKPTVGTVITTDQSGRCSLVLPKRSAIILTK